MIRYDLEFTRAIQRVFEALFPHLDCVVSFANDPEQFPNGERGFVLFPDDGDTPQILVNADIPYAYVPDVLAHELAHLAAPPLPGEAPHTELWERTYRDILAKMCGDLQIDPPEFIPNLREVMNGEPEDGQHEH